jgi:ABC-type uncharacterized transport system substrate-binding protein
MRRRDFIKAIACSAAAWPIAAPAEQPATPVVGFLHLTSLETNRENLATFRRGLEDTGYIEGKNVAIEYRWAQGRNDRFPTLVAELVRRQVSVIVVLESTNGALAAKAATQTIPIVFMQGADPVQIGLVDSLNRPGGNLTGYPIQVTFRTAFAMRVHMFQKFFAAPSPAIYRLSRRASSFSRSILRPRKRSASLCPRPCWRSPMR